MIKFKTGYTYYARSICDHECIYKFLIHNRTPKTVRVIVHDEMVTRRISTHNGVEYFKPFGSYSMSATIYANMLWIEGGE